VRHEAPHLRIIDPDLAARVDEVLQGRRSRYLAATATATAKNNGLAPHKAHGRYLLSGGMLVCPTCGGHFEARKYPWKPSRKTKAKLPPKAQVGHPDHVYICSTRRRKPGICQNTLALPIADTDNTVLEMIEGEILGADYIRELLKLVDTAPDETGWLTAERDRLQTEVERLVASIAAGVPADTVAPLIRTKEEAIRKLDARLRKPRLPKLGQAKLRAALEQRAREWKAELRAEPQIARMVLRRLVGPITLWDESERPDFVKWKATPTTELLGGLATLLEASPTRPTRLYLTGPLAA
jgi:hypothetical protein